MLRGDGESKLCGGCLRLHMPARALPPELMPHHYCLQAILHSPTLEHTSSVCLATNVVFQ